MMTRSTVAALAAGFGLALGASACAVTYEEGPSRYQAPMACYWLSNVTNRWQSMPQVQSRQQCYELDSCSGGLGASGGGCYKWSTGPDGPQYRW